MHSIVHALVLLSPCKGCSCFLVCTPHACQFWDGGWVKKKRPGCEDPGTPRRVWAGCRSLAVQSYVRPIAFLSYGRTGRGMYTRPLCSRLYLNDRGLSSNCRKRGDKDHGIPWDSVNPNAPSLSANRERDNRPSYSNRYVIRRPIRTASQTRVTVPEGLVITIGKTYEWPENGFGPGR